MSSRCRDTSVENRISCTTMTHVTLGQFWAYGFIVIMKMCCVYVLVKIGAVLHYYYSSSSAHTTRFSYPSCIEKLDGSAKINGEKKGLGEKAIFFSHLLCISYRKNDSVDHI